MENAGIIQAIRNKIEQRKKSLRAGICDEEVFTRKQRKEMLVASEELDRFNRFLSDLEKSEKPMDGLEEEIIKCWQEWISPSNEQSEEGVLSFSEFAFYARHFAKWQKEQMIKGAIPCKVFWIDGPLLDYTQEQQDNALERIGANVGDNVKLIIVKEDSHE